MGFHLSFLFFLSFLCCFFISFFSFFLFFCILQTQSVMVFKYYKKTTKQREERTFNINLLDDRRGFFMIVEVNSFQCFENPMKL